MFNLPIKALILTVAMLFATAHALFSQNLLPTDPATGKVSYKFSIELDRAYKEKAVYNMVRDWFSQNAEQFTRSNTIDTGGVVLADKKRSDARAAVLQEFDNTKPLQTLDPESNRLSGKGILKYTGPANGCIRLFYIQYSVVITVSGQTITGDVSNFAYNHFNPRTFQSQPVFNWSGMMPCDNVNTLEYIKDCEACHTEFNTFYKFLNNDTEELINSLRLFVRATKGITMNEN